MIFSMKDIVELTFIVFRAWNRLEPTQARLTSESSLSKTP